MKESNKKRKEKRKGKGKEREKECKEEEEVEEEMNMNKIGICEMKVRVNGRTEDLSGQNHYGSNFQQRQ